MSKTLNVDVVAVPKTLLIKPFLSNFTTEESLRHNVDCADVNRLINSAFLEILCPKPQFVIILLLSIKYSNAKGPD